MAVRTEAQAYAAQERRKRLARERERLRRRRQRRNNAEEYRQILRLGICAAAFMALVGVKVFSGDHAAGLRAKLSQTLERNMDVQEVFSTVGQTFAGDENVSRAAERMYQAVFQPEELPGQESIPVLSDRESIPALPGSPDSDEASDNISASDSTSAQVSDGTDILSASDSASAQVSDSTSASGGAALKNTTRYEWTGRLWDGSALEMLHQDAGFVENSAGMLSGSATDSETPPDTAQSDGNTAPEQQSNSGRTAEQVNMEQVLLNFDYTAPVQGTLTSGFGYRYHPIEGGERFHYGIDLAAPEGTDIVCFADGTVTAVGESNSYGRYCMISHPGGFLTLYAHCSRVTALSGSEITRGEKIAEVGSTGEATGAHLHFELRQGNIWLNPVYYVVS